MNLVVLDGDGQDSRLEQEEEEEPVVLDESMLQGQFLYRAYQGELVKEEETVVLDSFAVQWFAVISSGRAGRLGPVIIWNKGHAQLPGPFGSRRPVLGAVLFLS